MIILNSVRCNHTTVGFLKDYRRINVAISRAKYLLIIIGNVKTLSKDKIWANLFELQKSQKIIS